MTHFLCEEAVTNSSEDGACTPLGSSVCPLTDAHYKLLLENCGTFEKDTQTDDIIVECVPVCSPELLNVAMEKLLCYSTSPRCGLVVVQTKEGRHIPGALFPREHGRSPLQESSISFGRPHLSLGSSREPSMLKSVCSVTRAGKKRFEETYKFHVTLVNEVQQRRNSTSTLLAKVWQQIPTESKPVTWFLTQSYVRLVEGKSLVTVHNVHPELDGTHLVDIFVGERLEQQCNGVLFCVRGLAVASRECEIEAPASRVVWKYNLAQIVERRAPPAYIDEQYVVRSDSILYHIELRQHSENLQDSELLQELRLMHASEGVQKQPQDGTSNVCNMRNVPEVVDDGCSHSIPLSMVGLSLPGDSSGLHWKHKSNVETKHVVHGGMGAQLENSEGLNLEAGNRIGGNSLDFIPQ